jgi:hypothetical protein
MTTELPAPGWYPDPGGKPGQTYWDGQHWRDHLPTPAVPSDAAATANAAIAVRSASPGPYSDAVHGAAQPSPTYAHKNPILYGAGGLFFPPLVLFLMGGNRTTCAWLVGLWVLFWLTIWIFFIGALFLLPLYFWSLMACYQEAVKQNSAHGLA